MRICLLGALFPIFVALKLFGLVDWSWWIVACPLWLATFWLNVLLIRACAIGDLPQP